MAAPIECSTEDKLEYQFYPNSSGFCQFRVRAANDAHIALTNGPQESDPMYEVFIGGWGNTKSVIRKNRSKPDKVEAETPNILNPDEFRGFWVRWGSGSIMAGREGESAPFLEWQDDEPLHPNHLGVCTGWGSCGSWIIEPPTATGSSAGPACWVSSEGGQVPDGAVPAGEDVGGELVFIARGRHESGALIPGKLVPSHGCCYIPWGGAEVPSQQYEVLCSCSDRANWVPVSGGGVPPQALPAGETEDGEPLYVGRVAHEGAVTPGKVHPSHGVCYIPFGGSEMAFPDYEILTVL